MGCISYGWDGVNHDGCLAVSCLGIKSVPFNLQSRADNRYVGLGIPYLVVGPKGNLCLSLVSSMWGQGGERQKSGYTLYRKQGKS